jgi:uncharacterized protein (TIGR02996 family)
MKRPEDLIADVQTDGDGGYWIGCKDGSESRFTATVGSEDLPCDFCGRKEKDFSLAIDGETISSLHTYSEDETGTIICSWCIRRACPRDMFVWRGWIQEAKNEQERALRETISQDPDDMTAHLALADWLEERDGDDPKAGLRIRFHRSFILERWE